MGSFYCQLDYEHVPFLSPVGAVNGNIANNGCGVCSAAMLVENMLGVSFPPEEAARLAKMCGARETFGVNFYIYAPVLAARFGMKVTVTEDAQDVLEFLQAGRGMVVANTRGDRPDDGYIGVFSDGGHYIVLAEAQGTTIKVWDPMYKEGSGRFDIPGRREKVHLDGTDAYADISVFPEDCKERPFFLFEKRETAAPAPMIGVTCGMQEEGKTLYLFRNYMQAILDAGGIPVILSLDTPKDKLAECIARLDGLLVTGGADADPASYGQEPVPQLGAVCPERDRLEIDAIRICHAMDKPVLGICRGEQMMAVAMGGTLIQDIPSQRPTPIDHYPCRTDWHIREAHRVETVRGTRLEVIAGGSYPVNSYHHQAVAEIPEGMRVCALSPDGLIEAIERCEGTLFLGVQWHPERLYREDANAAALFKAFVDVSRKGYAEE